MWNPLWCSHLECKWSRYISICVTRVVLSAFWKVKYYIIVATTKNIPCFRVVKHTSTLFHVFFFVLAWEYRFFHKWPPHPPHGTPGGGLHNWPTKTFVNRRNILFFCCFYHMMLTGMLSKILLWLVYDRGTYFNICFQWFLCYQAIFRHLNIVITTCRESETGFLRTVMDNSTIQFWTLWRLINLSWAISMISAEWCTETVHVTFLFVFCPALPCRCYGISSLQYRVQRSKRRNFSRCFWWS